MQSASSAATGGPRTSRDEYSTRQSYYLRISPYMVLLMSLFLDARDVRWMNSHQGQGEGLDSDEESDGGTDAEGGESRGETILAIALAHLKEVLMEKLLRESVGSTKSTNILAGAAAYDVKLDGNTLGAWSGKETVDIFEHPDFRMAFYFQRAAASGVGGGNRHAVLLKNKRLTFPHLQRRRRGDEAEVRGAHGGPSMPIPGPMNNQSAAALGGAALTGPVIGSMAPPPIPSKRRRAEPREDVTHDALQDVRIKPDPDAEPEFQPDNSYTDEWGFSTPQGDASQPVGARNQRAEEDEEEDKKPRLTVSYRGFRIFEKTLVVVLESTAAQKRAYPSLFKAAPTAPAPQLAAQPVRESTGRRSVSVTPGPGRNDAPNGTRRFTRNNGRTPSASPAPFADGIDSMRSASRPASSSRNAALFRSTPSEWTPTPTPEPETYRAQAARHLPHQGVADAAADPASVTDARYKRAPSVAFGRGDESEPVSTLEIEHGEQAGAAAHSEFGGAVGLAQRLYERQKMPLGMNEDDVELLER